MNDISVQIKELEEIMNTEGIPEETKKETQVAIDLLKNLSTLDSIKKTNDTFNIPIKFINKSENENPKYAQEGDSGFDFRANLETPITIKPMERVLVPTGLYFELPHGYELQIRPRSGMAYKHGITVLNTPGTVDTAYRGEIKCLLINLSTEEYTIENGDRIAQGVVAPRVSTEMGKLIETFELSETERGEGGFGSTGKK